MNLGEKDFDCSERGDRGEVEGTPDNRSVSGVSLSTSDTVKASGADPVCDPGERKAKNKGKRRGKGRKAPSVAGKRRKALGEWSRRVRNRDGGKCVVCLSDSYPNSHHILPKERYREFQFEDINGIVLCPSHHKWGKLSAHRNSVWFSEWLKENRKEQFEWVKRNIEGK